MGRKGQRDQQDPDRISLSADKAKNFANLNVLATITFLKGEALLKKGDTDGALAAYYTLLADYSFGQKLG